MTVGTLAQEIAKLDAIEEVGIELRARERKVLKVAKVYADTQVGGVPAIDETAVLGALTFARVTTAVTTGEVAVAGLNADGVVLVNANENIGAFYITIAAGKFTVLAATGDTALAEKDISYLVLDYGTVA